MEISHSLARAAIYSLVSVVRQAHAEKAPVSLTFYKEIRDKEGNVIHTASCQTLPDSSVTCNQMDLVSMELDVEGDLPVYVSIDDVKFKTNDRWNYCTFTDIHSVYCDGVTYDVGLFMLVNSGDNTPGIDNAVTVVKDFINATANNVVEGIVH